jgi:mxaJ protein
MSLGSNGLTLTRRCWVLTSWVRRCVLGCSVLGCWVLGCLVLGCSVLRASAAEPLRVCSDPNNMPFSNTKGEGFENKIAELLGRELGRPVTYFWSPQRRGFVRNTLSADRCDVIVGVPAGFDPVATTKPYYESSYVFVSRRSRALAVRSLDDPRLKRLRIGIQITGDDYDNPPAAQALAARHIITNVQGFTVYGDYSKPDPQRGIVDAVARGAVDLAIVWGPLAGYYARREPVAMDVVRVTPDRDGPALPFRFAIAMGVRHTDRALKTALDGIIARRAVAIRRILTSYGVPLS